MGNISKIKLGGVAHNINDSRLVYLTQAEYDSLANKDGDIIYAVEQINGASFGKTYKLYRGDVLISDSTFKSRLDALEEKGAKVSYGTTSYWQQHLSYIPEQGEFVVYTDHDSYVENNETVYVPGIKIGDGNAYGIDLPFIDSAIARQLTSHLNNTTIHVTAAEKASWNNKLCLHENPIVNNNLYLFND